MAAPSTMTKCSQDLGGVIFRLESEEAAADVEEQKAIFQLHILMKPGRNGAESGSLQVCRKPQTRLGTEII